MSTFLNPGGTHVGDPIIGAWGHETIIAYGHWTDDLQSVITLMPRSAQAPSRDRPTTPPIPGRDEPTPSNYCTFFRDGEGRRTHVEWHSNLVEAVNRYTDEMGMDI